MDLREYWVVIARRWWILAGFTLAAFALSFAFAPRTADQYVATVRAAVSLRAEPQRADVFGFDRFYAFQSAEFLVDDFAEVLRSQAFSEDVARTLGDPSITPGMVQDARRVEKTHRILTVTVGSGNPDATRRMAEATMETLEAVAPTYFIQLDAGDARVSIIDEPVTVAISGAQRTALDIALRTALGFAVGLVLVFLLHAVDRTLYTTREFESALDVPILGEIPPDRLNR